MQNPELDRALDLLIRLGEADEPAREYIARQLDSMPVYAASLDKGGAVLFQNKRQRGVTIPEMPASKADFVNIVHSGGETVNYSAIARASDDGGGEGGYYLVGTGLENDPAKLPLEKITSDMERLAGLVEESPVITLMIIPNAGMDVIFISENIDKLGYSRDKFYLNRIGWIDAVHPEDRLGFVEDVGRLIKISARFSHKYRLLTADGDVLHVRADMTVMRDAAGKPIYFEGTVTDITDQAEIEEAIAESAEKNRFLLQAVEDPETYGCSGYKLGDILSTNVIDTRFAIMADEYGLFIALFDANSGNIGAWAPSGACIDGRTPREECAARMDASLMFAMKDVLPKDKHQIIEYNGKSIGMAAIYIGGNMAAYCCFCEAGRAYKSGGDFSAVCELVAIACESLSVDCAQNIELLLQADKLRLLRETADRDHEERSLMNELIAKLYAPDPEEDTVSGMISLAGKRLGVSRIYLYEPTPSGNLCITREFTQSDLIRLPVEAGIVERRELLPGDGEGIQRLSTGETPFLILCGAVSALHYPIYIGAELQGVVGFAECLRQREYRWDFFSGVFKVFAEALLWEKTRRTAALTVSSLSSMLEKINALIFVSDYHGQRILFINSKLRGRIAGSAGSPDNPDSPDGPDSGQASLSPELLLVLPGQSSSSGECLMGGRWYKKTVSPIDWTDGRKALLVCLFDIHDIKEQEMKIEYAAYHDPLLGIYNRRRFDLDIEQVMSRAEQEPGALLLFDLDDFKYINDAYGHDKGDEVLRRFTMALKPMLGDSVYRYGGDEFMALLRGVEPARLRELVNEVVHTLQAPVSDSEDELMCTASIGVARYPQDGHITRDLLRSVDMAMYQAKREGKGAAFFFTPDMETAAQKHGDLDKLLKLEVEGGCSNMTLLYQPIFCTTTGELFGVEALLRWHPPGLEVIMPEEFIGMAEMLGLMYEIGGKVLDRAISDVAEMQKRGLDIVMSVNMFVRQLQSTGLARIVLSLLKKRSCPPSSLMLEMTERMTLYDYHRKNSQIAKLREAGVLICADDFGAGQSSSSHLREKLWDLVKIDCKGVREMHLDHYTRTFVKTRINIAHAAGVKVCAEGVESEEQRALLAAFGCDYIQGYLMDYPVTRDTVLEKYSGK